MKYYLPIMNSRLLAPILVTFFLFLFAKTAVASHALGGDLGYRHLRGDLYELTLNVYRDCNGIGLRNTQIVNWSSSCGIGVSALTLDTVQEVSRLCLSSVSACDNGGGPYGIERYEYRTIVNIPSFCKDIYFSWDICCRNNSITNITSSGFTQLHVETYLSNTGTPFIFSSLPNSTPIFANTTSFLSCTGLPVNQNLGATDPDGDSLQYSLVDCQSSSGVSVNYASGFSGTNPLGSGITIDAQTGAISYTTNTPQVAVICIQIEEYRNGLLVGSSVRDVQLRVVNCPNTPPVLSGVNNGSNFVVNTCLGQSLDFSVVAIDPDLDNVTISTHNTGVFSSAVFTQTADTGRFVWLPTPSDIGTHTLIMNVEDDACPIKGSNSFTYTINVLGAEPPLVVSADTAICRGTVVPLTVSTTSPNVSSYRWFPSRGLSSTNTATVLANPNFSTSYMVEVTYTSGCVDRRSITVDVDPTPIVGVYPNNKNVCAGSTVNLRATADRNGMQFTWRDAGNNALFNTTTGTNSFATVTMPTATGTYTWTVEVTNPSSGCSVLETLSLTVNQPSANLYCNTIYVSTTGSPTGLGTSNDPTTLEEAINKVVCDNRIIKLATGIYTVDSALVIGSYTTLEGGFQEGASWQKTSAAGATTIRRSNNDPQGTIDLDRHLTAINIIDAEGFRLQDLTVEVEDANSSDFGTSVYGVYMQNVSNYNITRVQVFTGDASEGRDGLEGCDGADGQDGADGSVTGIPGDGGAGAGGWLVMPGRYCVGNVPPTLPTTYDPSGMLGNNGRPGINGLTMSSQGGAGGVGGWGAIDNGGNNAGGDGGPGGRGSTLTGVNGPNGNDGIGYRPPNDDAEDGEDGEDGVDGNNAGTPSTIVSYLNGRRVLGKGADGENGGGGNGGNGGGGSKNTGASAPGASGGSGGGGGGGAHGGEGGGGGGSSFGIFIDNNGAGGNIIDCNIVAGIGGVGGNGGIGGHGGNHGGNASEGGDGERTSGIGGTTGSGSNGDKKYDSGKGGEGGHGGDGGEGGVGRDGISQELFVSPGSVSLSNDIINYNLSSQRILEVEDINCKGQPITFNNGLGLLLNWDFSWNSAVANTAIGVAGAVNTSYTVSGRYTIETDPVLLGSTFRYTDFHNILQLNIAPAEITTTALPLNNNPDTVSLCLGQFATFESVSNGVSYTWDFDGAIANPGNVAVTPSTSFNTAGVYTVVLEVESGCCSNSVADSIILVVTDIPTINSSLTTLSICEDEATVLTVAGLATTDTLIWTPSQQLLYLSSNSVQVQPINDITYTATAYAQLQINGQTYYNYACPASIDFVVNVEDRPILALNQVDIGCAAPGSVSATVTGGNHTFDWSNGVTQTTGSNSVINGLTTPDNYCVTAINNITGCQDSACIYVGTNNTFPILSFTNNTGVSCVGAADGSVRIQGSGGVGGYQFSWTPSVPSGNTSGVTNYTLNNLTTGSYFVTLLDTVNNCQDTQTLVIVAPNELVVDTLQLVAPTCAGQQDGLIEIEATGGTGFLSYQWSSGDTTALVSGLDTGLYTITITDDNGCTLIHSIYLSDYLINFSINVTITSNYNGWAVSCADACDGAASVNIVGPVGNYDYTWSDASFGNTNTLIGLCADTFYVTVTETGICPVVDTLLLIAPDSLFIDSIATTPTACTSTTGSAIATVAGGTVPYYYNWSNGQTQISATGLAAASYSLTVTDINGCTATDTVTIDIAPNPAPPTILSTQRVCEGDTLWLTSTTLMANSYVWQNTTTGFMAYQRDTFIFPVTRADTGTYSLTISNSDGCTASSWMAVAVNVVPQQPVLSGASICLGDDLALVNANPCAWTRWLSPSGDTLGTANGRLDLMSTDLGYAGGNWTAWCVDLSTGCSAAPSLPYAINIEVPPSNLSLGNNSPICYNTSAVLTVGAANAYTYIWSSNSLRSDTLGIGTTFTSAPLTSNTTFYLHALTSLGCDTIITVPVSLWSPAPTVTITATATNLCEGDNLILTANSGANAYAWRGPLGNLSTTNTVSLSNVQAGQEGWYTVVITDVYGCAANDSIYITINRGPTAPTLTQLPSLCVGDSLRLTHNGTCDSSIWIGPTGTTYSTLGNYLAIDSNSRDYQNGTWVVRCVDATTGCSALSAPLAVVLPVAPMAGVIRVTSPVICYGDSASWQTTTIAGATSYRWYNQSGTISLAGQLVGLGNLTTNTVLYLEVEQNTCIYTIDSAAVQVRALPSAPAITGNLQLCAGDDLILTSPTAAASYTWTTANNSTDTSRTLRLPAITVQDSGYYNLSAITINGCTTAVDSVFIIINERPVAPVILSPASICSGDSLILDIGAGACDRVLWTAPDGRQWGGNRLAFAPNDLGYLRGVWEVSCIDTVTYCSSPLSSITITIQTVAAPLILNNGPVCIGDSSLLRAGGSFNTVWYRDIALTDTAGTGNRLLVSNIQADSTYYVVNTAINGCRSTTVVATLSVFPILNSLDAGLDQVLCTGEDLSFTTTNPFTSYYWTGPNNWVDSVLRSPVLRNVDSLNTGAYIVAARDINGCVQRDTVIVLVQDLPTPPTIPSLQIICTTDTLFLNPDPNTGSCDSMFWVNRNGQIVGGSQVQVLPTDPAFDGGQWFLYCLDTTTNCSSRSNAQSVVILPPPAPQAVNNSGPVCKGGAVRLSTNPGTGFTQFYWYANSNQDSIIATGQNPTIQNITTDTTFYLVIDNGSGCRTAALPTYITVTNPSTAPTIIADTSLCVGDVLLLASAVPAATYQWTGPNSFVSTNALVSIVATNGLSGTYSLTTEDSLGCLSLPASINITINTPAAAAQLSTNAPICVGKDLELSTSGSCTSYEWVSPLGNRIVGTTDSLILSAANPNYQAGNWYHICIDSSTGCAVISDTITVVLEDAPVLLGAINSGPVCAGELVQLTAPLGAGSLANLLWFSDRGLQVSLSNPFTPTASQWVYVEATNSLGCTTIDSTFVTVYQLSTGNVLPTVDSLCEGEAVVLQSLLTGSQYQWTGPNAYTSNVQQPAALIANTTTAGYYFLTLTDQNGCTRQDSVLIVVDTLPTAPSITTPVPLCVGDNFTLSVPAVTGYTYQWQRWPQGTVVSNSNSYTVATSTSADSGQYYVVLSNGGCSSSALDTVLVTIEDPSILNVFAGIDQQLCGQNNTVLTATGLPAGYVGTWTTASGAIINQINASSTVVNNLPLGTSVFYWTASYTSCGYQASDSVQITLQALGTDSAQAGVDQVICLPARLQLNANPTTSLGTWSQGLAQANGGVVIATPNQANSSLIGLTAGQSYEFVWSLNVAGCPVHSKDTMTILVNATPTNLAYAGEDIYACGADTVYLSALATSGTNGTWSSASSLSFADSSQANTWVSNWNRDTTVVYWTLSGGACRNYSQDSLLIINTPIALVANADVFQVVAGQSASLYVLNNDQWVGDGSIIIASALANGQLSNQNDGWFEVVATVGDSLQYFVYELCAEECPTVCDTALVTLQVDNLGDCNPPNIFTPNDDGVNDYFDIPCLQVRSVAYLAVFNRWGDQVYESDRYNNQWDGRHNGNPLPDGTYFYILRIANEKPIQGSVEIKR